MKKELFRIKKYATNPLIRKNFAAFIFSAPSNTGFFLLLCPTAGILTKKLSKSNA